MMCCVGRANSMAEVQFTAAPNRDYEDVAQSGAGPPGSWARVVMNASVTSGAGNGSLTASSPAGAPSSISAHISCSQESVPTVGMPLPFQPLFCG